MHVVLDPLMRDRVAIAHARAAGNPQGDEQTVAGIAIWATVSEAVDAKISEQVKAGVFPVRLTNEDWVSGDTVWLLDVIANDRNQATRVLANFKQLSGDRPVKIHPIVARVVDPKALEAMRARPADGVNAAPASIPEPQGNA
jgi:cytolysin-activating lysine-acyltransferase